MRVATSAISAFGVHALLDGARRMPAAKLLVPPPHTLAEAVVGSIADRAERNRLSLRGAASRAISWLDRVETRVAPGRLPQSTLIVDADARGTAAMVGACALTTEGLGLTPADRLGIVQLAEDDDEVAMFAEWFDDQWQALAPAHSAHSAIRDVFAPLASRRAAAEVYLRTLDAIFADMGEGSDEESIVKSATGIRDTVIWSKLYRFQRDGAIGAIDKLQRFGGCILADSVGLGKTFEGWPSSSITSCATAGCWFSAPSACARTGQSGSRMTAATSWRPTGSTMTC